MEVLSSRVLLRPRDAARSHRFYGETLGLAVYREFPGGVVYFIGGGYLEVSGDGAEGPPNEAIRFWLQVRDLDATHHELKAKGVEIERAPEIESWGLKEMWIADPDGLRIVVVEVPEDHPIRRR